MKKITSKSKRSPLFYVGDKYKLVSQLNDLFPRDIDCFVDLFCGGGSVSLNCKAKSYIMNDSNPYIIQIHEFLNSKKFQFDNLVSEFYNLINNYKLSHSEISNCEEINKIKIEYPKTYFSKYNKDHYLKLRNDYNKYKNVERLYLLLVYGFNHMIRFNNRNEFNLPVGNVDWNKNVTKALHNYIDWVEKNSVDYLNYDFEDAISTIEFRKRDFLYCDPPYLITFSEYNKNWTEKEEIRLYSLLDQLDKKGIRWGVSNMLKHKGKKNNILDSWARSYNIFDIKSNYISRFDNSIKKDSQEIYITNYILGK